MTKSEYLEENRKWLSDDNAAAICQIPDAAWDAVVEATGTVNTGASDPGIDCGVTITHETFGDFEDSRANFWTEKGSMKRLTIGGYPALHFERFQLRRGQPRHDQIVLDLGDIRIALV
jgi:hypothetical protein